MKNNPFNPYNISLNKLNAMSPEERNEFFEEIVKSEKAKLWMWFTAMSHYMCMTGYWQYAIALWYGN